MFWEAFVWGLGVSCGGALGLLSFILLFWGAQWIFKREAMKAAREVAELSLAALTKRNELTEQQIEHLADIATALWKVSEKGS